jgi:hypothetical protein
MNVKYHSNPIQVDRCIAEIVGKRREVQEDRDIKPSNPFESFLGVSMQEIKTHTE